MMLSLKNNQRAILIIVLCICLLFSGCSENDTDQGIDDAEIYGKFVVDYKFDVYDDMKSEEELINTIDTVLSDSGATGACAVYINHSSSYHESEIAKKLGHEYEEKPEIQTDPYNYTYRVSNIEELDLEVLEELALMDDIKMITLYFADNNLHVPT